MIQHFSDVRNVSFFYDRMQLKTKDLPERFLDVRDCSILDAKTKSI